MANIKLVYAMDDWDRQIDLFYVKGRLPRKDKLQKIVNATAETYIRSVIKKNGKIDCEYKPTQNRYTGDYYYNVVEIPDMLDIVDRMTK